MITVHNLQDGVAKPVVSSIVYEKSGASKVKPGGADGWQAYSGKSTVTWPSPQATSEDATADVTALTDMSMDNVNRARMIDISIGTGTDDLSVLVAKTGKTHLLSASKFGNWRNRSINGFSDISERVMLQCDGVAPKSNYSITYTTENLDSVVLKNPIADKVTKLSNTVNDLAALGGALAGDKGAAVAKAALTGERMSRYQNMKVMDMAKTQTSGGLDSLKFQFRFGQAGIFSGEEEVVKPILALVSPFALNTGEGFHSVTGPLPTKVTANRKALLATIDIVRGTFEGQSSLRIDTDAIENASGTAEEVVTAFNNVTDTIYQAIDQIAESLFSQMKTVVVIIGGVVMGPFTVGGVSWEFDFDNVDEYGYPCSGSVSYTGLSPIRLYTKSDYARQWGYSVGSSDSMDAITKAQLAEEAVEKKITMAEIDTEQAVDTGTKPN